MKITINKEQIKNKTRKLLDTVGRGAIFSGVALAIGYGSAAMASIGGINQATKATKDMTAEQVYDYYQENPYKLMIAKAVNRVKHGKSVPVKTRTVDRETLYLVTSSPHGRTIPEDLPALDKLIVTREQALMDLTDVHNDSPSSQAKLFYKALKADEEISKIIGDDVLVTNFRPGPRRLPTLNEQLIEGIDRTLAYMKEEIDNPNPNRSKVDNMVMPSLYMDKTKALIAQLRFAEDKGNLPLQVALAHTNGGLEAELSALAKKDRQKQGEDHGRS